MASNSDVISKAIRMNLNSILAFLVYTLLGSGLMAVSFKIFDKLFKADIEKEIFENRNIAAGIVVAGLLIGVAVIAASAMH